MRHTNISLHLLQPNSPTRYRPKSSSFVGMYQPFPHANTWFSPGVTLWLQNFLAHEDRFVFWCCFFTYITSIDHLQHLRLVGFVIFIMLSYVERQEISITLDTHEEHYVCNHLSVSSNGWLPCRGWPQWKSWFTRAQYAHFPSQYNHHTLLFIRISINTPLYIIGS